MKNLLKQQSTEVLMEAILKLDDNSNDVVFNELLNELEVRLSEDKFLELCTSL
jgi:hypothetical protein